MKSNKLLLTPSGEHSKCTYTSICCRWLKADQVLLQANRYLKISHQLESIYQIGNIYFVDTQESDYFLIFYKITATLTIHQIQEELNV